VGGTPRDVSAVQVPQLGRVVLVGPGAWRLLGADGVVVGPVEAFVAELATGGCTVPTCRSFCYHLMRCLGSSRRCRSAARPPGAPTGGRRRRPRPATTRRSWRCCSRSLPLGPYDRRDPLEQSLPAGVQRMRALLPVAAQPSWLAVLAAGGGGQPGRRAPRAATGRPCGELVASLAGA